MIKEMFIKTIVRYFFTAIRIIITKILTIISGSKNMKEKYGGKVYAYSWWQSNRNSCYEKQCGPKGLNYRTTKDSQVSGDLEHLIEEDRSKGRMNESSSILDCLPDRNQQVAIAEEAESKLYLSKDKVPRYIGSQY